MDFLKKNYEKLILAVLLVVFVCLLAVQLMLWEESRSLQEERYNDPAANYVPVIFEGKDAVYQKYETLQTLTMWKNSVSRSGQKVHTDLMEPYPMGLCPHCVRVIPISAFPAANTAQVTQCPLCTRDLHAPLRPELHKNLDTDGDGIPDRVERQLGLNYEDRTDGRVDSDADGFSNYEEYVMKTDIKDPKNRPPYHTQFHVDRIVRPVLPFRLKNVTIRDRNKLETAMIQIEIDLAARRRKKDSVIKLNDSFDTMAGRFKVIQLKPNYRRNSMGIEMNNTEIILLKEGAKDPISMRVGQPAYETRDEIHLIRHTAGGDTEHELYIGNELKLGSMKTGEEVYKVVSADRARKQVVLEFKGKKITIGSESEISKRIKKAPKVVRPPRVRKKKN